MRGTFYGVGVGPGDPELLTLKAIHTIEACEVLAVPVSGPHLKAPVLERNGAENGTENDTGNTAESGSGCRHFLESCTAYQIVRKAGISLEQKDILYLPMPMMKDKEALNQVHDGCAAAAAELLGAGKSIACITIGDPSVYSTCVYIQKRILKMGYDARLIPGVPSFCAAAARMNMSLVEGSEELHVIPATYEIEQGLLLPGTKILMKVGKKLPYVKEAVKAKGLEIGMVEDCGMETEKLYRDVDEIPERTSYYSLFILKDRKGEQ